MFRPTPIEVALRRQEMLRDAEQRRWVATIRRTDRWPNRIAQAFGFRTAPAF